jgi:hypothetical protein
MLTESRAPRSFSSIKTSSSMSLSHLLFVYDLLCFSKGSLHNLEALKGMMDLYCKVTRMQINEDKACLLSNIFPPRVSQVMFNLFPYHQENLEEGFKYFGFNLKPDNYWFVDWF